MFKKNGFRQDSTVVKRADLESRLREFNLAVRPWASH